MKTFIFSALALGMMASCSNTEVEGIDAVDNGEPNKAKSGQSSINQNNSIGVWVSVISLLTTIAVLIFK